MLDRRIGAQLFTVRDYCQNIKDFDDTCKKLKEIGYKFVQLSAVGPMPAAEVKTVLDKYGFFAVCTHKGKADYLENIDKTIEYHKEVGCNIAGLGMMHDFEPTREKVEGFIKTYNKIADKLYENGLVFAYHNHAFEFMKIDGKFIFDMLMENTKPDRFKFILDVYWLAFAGVDPAEYIRKLSGRIDCIHFKDLKVFSDNKQDFCEIMEGNLNWDKIIKACDESGVKYALVEQDTCPGNPFDSLKISYDNLKTKGFC